MEFVQTGVKNEILYWGKRLYQKGMSPSTSGNISIKTKEGILITASGTCANDLSEDDIVLIDYDGNLKDGNKKPSSEKIMHSEIYTLRNDINAIIHCHCPLITSFAVAGIPIKKAIIPDFVYEFDEIPLVPYFCPSSIELAQSVGKRFEKYNAVLLKNHGIVIGDVNLQQAFYKLEIIRNYVEIYFGSQVLGKTCLLNRKQQNEIKNLKI